MTATSVDGAVSFDVTFAEAGSYALAAPARHGSPSPTSPQMAATCWVAGGRSEPRPRIHTDSNPPAGALVYYKGGAYGHVAISIGNGQEVGTLGNAGQRLPVQQYPVRGFITSPFLGWANPLGS